MPSPLSAERWKSLEPLIDAAADLPRDRRPAFLDQACGDDPRLRAELEHLLLHYERDDTLLDHPAAQRFESLLGVVAFQPPELINGNYRIERKLGQGGMATVYLAHDIRHDRKVAVKVLHPELSAAFRSEQFLAEIRTMAQLQHPHILQLHDSGEVDGLLFYVMPYVEGETLRQRIDRGVQLDPEEAVRITREVASALDSAHRHGVIHRDIKPENILLGEGGALVADFGIALAISTASARDRSQPGWIAGTPRYMSPEQISGAATIDGRSDVYALGAVAYEMLTGQPPFAGPTVTAILAGTVAVAPPPSLRALRGVIPPATDAVVAQALARLPEDRYPTGGEFADALQRSLAVRRSRRSAALAAIAIIAVAAAVVGTRLGSRQDAASAAVPASAAPYGRHQTRNLAAYDLYQRARDQLFSRSDSGMQVAIGYYKQAIAADSTYAAAYAGLAYTYSLRAGLGAGQEVRADAQAAALKAVSLDDSLADAHVALAVVGNGRYDIASAIAELQRAIALDPAGGRAHAYLGYNYCLIGRPAEALAEVRRATELDPLSVESRVILVGTLDCNRLYDEALALVDTLRQVSPPLGGLSGQAAHIYMSKGMWPEAIAELGGKDAEPSGQLGAALAHAGYRGEARRMLAKLIEGGEAFDVALVYEALGDYDNAFVWLDKSLDERRFGFGILVDPLYGRLRADPRFERIRRRVNRSGFAR